MEINTGVTSKNLPITTILLKNNRLRKTFIALIIIVCISSVLSNAYLINHNSQLNQYIITLTNTPSPQPQSTTAPLPTTKPLNNYCPSISEQAELNKFADHLKTALDAYQATFNGQFQTTDKGLEFFKDHYQFEYNGESYTIYLSIFRNFEGIKTEVTYEGGSVGTRDYDSEKELYLTLDEGVHQVDMWYSGYSREQVTVKTIGGRKYLIFDSSFLPSGTISKNYLIYSEKVGNLIQFSLTSDQDVIDEGVLTESDTETVVKYSGDFQGFIDEVESAILEPV